MNLIAAGLCILAALALFGYLRLRRKALGLPAGKIIYMDTDRLSPAEQSIYNQKLGLVGKPDYLVESGDQIIPVEIKSTRNVSAPYDAHIFQLAAYCLLVQHHYGKRPAYGILRYPNRTYSIEYTEKLEEAVLAIIEEMHQQDRRKELHRSHDNPMRCRGCGYQKTCEQRLL